MLITIHGRPIAKKNSRNIFYKYGKLINTPSDAYHKFEKDALQQLVDSKVTRIAGVDEKRRAIYKCSGMFSGKVFINYIFHLKGLGNIDGDNIQAGINDILQKAGVISNDRNMREWHGKIIENSKEWKTEIAITPIEDYVMPVEYMLLKQQAYPLIEVIPGQLIIE